MLHVLLLVGCAVGIYASCEWFVNAVEWLGQRLRLGPVAVGTVLAAFGTALPESVVTFVAVVLGGDARTRDLGVGAAMGGPLVLATVAYGVTGLMLLVTRAPARRARRDVRVPVGVGASAPTPDAPDAAEAAQEPAPAYAHPEEMRKLSRDQILFLAVFVAKVALGLVAFAVKPWLGLLFFAAYAAYFVRALRSGSGEHEELRPLFLQRRRPRPATWAVVVQTVGALGVVYGASQLFVGQLDAVGPLLGLPPAVTALLLAPVATELPEIMNAVIWVRQGKPRLALANISGAMMIQATVPSGLGLLFTPWRFDAPLVLAGVVTMAAMAYLIVLLRRGRLTARSLLGAAAFYAVFAIGLAVV
ncbi:MAG TPA: sodium:calcium antiporter [Streptosporangiales bacterium]